MTMLGIMGVLLVFTALALAASAARNAAPSTGVARSLELIEAMTTAPSELTADLDKSFGERVLIPLQNRFAGLGRRLSGADSSERIRRKLDLAGNPPGWTVDRVMSGKVVGAMAGFVGGVLFSFMLGSPMTKILVVVGVTLAGFFAPAMYLYQRTYDRSNRMQRELPDAIDLLTISVESGLGFDAALQQVAHNTEGPLADEFSRVLREMQIGSSRSEALRALAERTNLVELPLVRQRDGPGRRLRHPDRQRPARAVVRDAREASSARRGEGPAGAGQDDHPADLLHPSRPVHHRHGTRRHPDHGPVRRPQ